MKNAITLGLIIETEEVRDAVHIALAPVIAEHNLLPGQHVGFIDTENNYKVGLSQKKIGIVDPYLLDMVKAGERFWLMLYPNSITSLKHEWTHPDFDGKSNPIPTGSAHSIAWIEAYARDSCDGMSYDQIMEAGREWIEEGEYTCHGGRFEGLHVNDEFWIHYKIITGVDGEGSFFTCSC